MRLVVSLLPLLILNPALAQEVSPISANDGPQTVAPEQVTKRESEETDSVIEDGASSPADDSKDEKETRDESEDAPEKPTTKQRKSLEEQGPGDTPQTEANIAGSPEVIHPSLALAPEIPYPRSALEAKIEGSVVLLVTVDALGHVTNAEALEGPGPELNEAAAAGVLRFKFEPARVNGIPRAAKVKFVHEFKLPREEPTPDSDFAPATREAKVAPSAKRIAKPPPAPPAEEVTVTGERQAQRLARSANAVTVIELDRAKGESSDLGKVLSRVEGISFQRSAGLGSPGRFNMAGFDDGQVRAFVDGIPIELVGYPFGLANVPVGMAERVDVYKGVVPIRLGADALGGAFNLISDHQTLGTAGSFSYQGGSFDSHRLAASARHRDRKTGLFAKVESFFDTTDNNYRVDDIPSVDNLGQVTRTSAYRFHDRFQARGANVELGLVDRKWAQRLMLKAFVSDFRKDFQHGTSMEQAFGEANYGELSTGGSLRFKEYFGAGVSAEIIGGYSFNQSDWEDLSKCIYNWFGRCVFEPANPGEVSAGGSDRSLWAHTGYSRMHLSWIADPEHILRTTSAPTYFTRTGKERLIDGGALDRLGGKRQLFKLVNGLEYETHQFDGQLQNIAFVKQYYQKADSHQPITEDWLEEAHAEGMYWGGGDGIRYIFNDWLVAKASYEWATRLPDARALFGNGSNIDQNPKLEPERSHNTNLTTQVQSLPSGFGKVSGEATGFFRRTDNMIVRLAADDFFIHENIGETRTLGVEGAASWLSPGDYVELSANATYQDVRNVSSDGEFASFKGERLPNRPYFFSNGSVRLQKTHFLSSDDTFSLTWYGRYVHSFLKSWEGFGTDSSQHSIDSQFTQDAVLAYVVRGTVPEELTFSGEVQNITDERVFDFYKIQRPGRTVYFKSTMTY